MSDDLDEMRQGPSARGIALAVGDILALVDADVVAPGHALSMNLNEDVQGFPGSDERHLLEVRSSRHRAEAHCPQWCRHP